MFTLATDRSKYFRVKRGQRAGEIEKTLTTPVSGGVFEGAIIKVTDEKAIVYTAKVGDTLRSVAKKFGVTEEELKNINCDKPVYPTCKLFVPCK